jgi:hypothetical protein
MRVRIERLVRERLVGKQFDGVAFVEELLAIANLAGEVRCSPVADQGLRFELPGSAPIEVDVDRNRGKLRMLCARLAVLCQESGSEFLLYGGEGTIRRTVKPPSTAGPSEDAQNTISWYARWTNTPGKHEFSLSAMR